MARHRIRITPPADEDIDEHFAYLARTSLDVAVRFYDALWDDLRQLSGMPGMGPVYGFSGSKLAEIRFWPIGGFRNHLIFYRPIPGGIEVIRVLHGARNIAQIFENDGE